MFRKIITGLMVLVTVLPLLGADVSQSRALLTAKNFFSEKFLFTFSRNMDSQASITALPHFMEGELVYYIVGFPQRGFVAIAGDDRCSPVLAYSNRPLQGIEDMPDACASWFDGYAEQILYVKKNMLHATEKNTSLWNKYGSEQFIPEKNPATSGVGPLLTCEWGQKYYYNNSCPVDPDGPGGHAIAGCVATAMAQVLYYYRYPLNGEGANGYMSDYGYEYVDFEEETYLWDEMVNRVYGKQNPEIARLVYHVGVSVEMNYGPSSSGAFTEETADALRSYFKYNDNVSYISLFDLGDAFKDSVIDNLNRQLVMIYRGGGLGNSHSFVCDGYQDSTYLHFNWGWDGNYNGYYSMDNLHPGTYDFTFDQGAVINIYPREGYPSYCQGNATLAASRGTFIDGSGPELYQDSQTCSWLISPDEEGISNIQLWFPFFNTEENADLLSIHDGPTINAPLLGQFSGEEIPPMVVSSGNEILLVFESNESIGSLGWQAEYLAYSGPFCNPQSQLNAMSVNYLTDGSGPYNYIDLSDCEWLINPQSEDLDSVSSLDLNFHWVELEQGDTLYIHDGPDNAAPLLGKAYGAENPGPLHSTGNQIYMNFLADESINANGWALGYSSNLPVYCADTLIFTDKTGTIEDGSGEKKYVPNSNCYWLIETENTAVMTFEFLEFDLEYGYDQLRFFDASNTPPALIATFWGHTVPPVMNINTDKVLILFVSDASEEFGGWKINYSALAPGVPENDLANRMLVYPNPARGKVYAEITHGQYEQVNYEVFDASMCSIRKGVFNSKKNSKAEIDVSALHPGVYFILFQNETSRYIRKLIIF